jgi:hypothetical protein
MVVDCLVEEIAALEIILHERFVRDVLDQVKRPDERQPNQLE